MRPIYINGISLAEKEIFGIQRFTYEMLKELDKYVEKDSLRLFVPEKMNRELNFKNISLVKLKKITASKIQKRYWLYFGMSRYAKKHGGMYMDTLLTSSFNGSNIYAYYDCIFERMPQDFDNFKMKLARVKVLIRSRINLKRAKVIITVSKHSKNDIAKIYNIPSEKIVVIYTGWQHFDRISADDSIIERLGLKKNEYCFSLGSRYYHKNFKWVAAAARQNPKYTFVVSGSNLLSTSDSKLNDEKPNNLIFTGYLSDGEIKALMAGCKVFIQPSLYEGAGMPPMEAMSTGARCIVSNRTSLPELYGNSVWYIDPEKYEGIDIDGIMSGEIADNKEVLDRFSWAKSARRMYALLKKVADK